MTGSPFISARASQVTSQELSSWWRSTLGAVRRNEVIKIWDQISQFLFGNSCACVYPTSQTCEHFAVDFLQMPFNEDLIQTCKNRFNNPIHFARNPDWPALLTLIFMAQLSDGAMISDWGASRHQPGADRNWESWKGLVSVPFTGAGGERGVVNV